MPLRSWERRDYGDRFDLDEQVVADQSPDLHGGAGRWLLGIDVLVANLANHGELGGVDQVVGELDDLLEAGPDGLQRRPEVVEHLPRLGTDVARPDQRPGAVEGHLPGDVDRSTSRHLHHMGVAGRVVHRLWVDEVGGDRQLRG